jgi:hypothetical protein
LRCEGQATSAGTKTFAQTFCAKLERSVTEQAPLVIECLNDVRARAKHQLAPQQPLLQCGILESATLAPYLERWRLDAAAAATRARCAYPTLDERNLFFCVSASSIGSASSASCIIIIMGVALQLVVFIDTISTTEKNDMDPCASLSLSAGLKAAHAAQLEAHVRALQNPPPPDPTIVVRAPPPSPDAA